MYLQDELINPCHSQLFHKAVRLSWGRMAEKVFSIITGSSDVRW